MKKKVCTDLVKPTMKIIHFTRTRAESSSTSSSPAKSGDL
jgi:hypothetical protein